MATSVILLLGTLWLFYFGEGAFRREHSSQGAEGPPDTLEESAWEAATPPSDAYWLAGHWSTKYWVDMQIAVSAREFYYETLPKVMDETLGSLEHKGLVILNGIGDSLFKDYLKAYVGYDFLRSGDESLAKEAVDFYLSDPPQSDIYIPASKGKNRYPTCASRIDSAVEDYTFQHGRTVEEIRNWWQANRKKTRDQWAREIVEPVVWKKEPLSDEERRLLLFVTYNLSVARPDGVEEFKDWWIANAHKSRTERLKALIENSIRNLTDVDPVKRQDALDQVFAFCTRDELEQIHGELPEWASESVLRAPDWAKKVPYDRKWWTLLQDRAARWWKHKKDYFVDDLMPTMVYVAWLRHNEWSDDD